MIHYIARDKEMVPLTAGRSKFHRRFRCTRFPSSRRSCVLWGKVFPDQVITRAAIDRLVHHATILEMNVESYARRAVTESGVTCVRT